MYNYSPVILLIFNLLLASACGPGSTEPKPSTAEVPKVSDTATNLLFSWFDGPKAQTAASISEVPAAHQKAVRVQDLSVAPEDRDPTVVFLVDLSTKQSNGRYKTWKMSRKDYDALRHKPRSERPANDPAINKPIVMYSTPHCPVCKKARKWLLDQGFAYKEIDISKDAAAGNRLSQLGQEQGISTAGVPMFEIGGKLIPGFDPNAIKQALRSTDSAPDLPAPARLPAGRQPPASGTVRI